MNIYCLQVPLVYLNCYKFLLWFFKSFFRPKIHWFLDGIEITETRKEFDKKSDDNNFTLVIKEATTELQGKYSCKIENSYGSETCESFVTVNCK